MALPTLPDSEKQNDKLNPGQQDYDRRFNDIARNEEQGTFKDIANNFDKTADGSQENNHIDKLREKESEGDSGFKSSYTGSKTSKKGKAKGWFKKAGPATGILGILFGGGFGIMMLTSPSLLLVHMKETFTDKFNTSLASADVRTTKLNMTKINDQTKGFCSSIVSIKCKFSTMSKKQVAKFEKAGIEVFPKNDTRFGGRTKPTHYVFKGQEIRAVDFNSMVGKNPAFRSAIKLAYNPKYAGFSGKAWAGVSKYFGISKQPPDLSGKDESERRKKVNAIARDGIADKADKLIVAGDKKTNCEGTTKACTYTSEEADTANKQAAAGKAAFVESGKSGSSADKVRNALSGAPLKGVSSALSITGVVDGYCMAYGTLNAIQYAQKTVLVLQLARTFMIYSSMADAIKSGDSPNPEEVALLGTLLTSTVKNADGKTIIGSATDSLGFKYAAYGDSSGSVENGRIATRFMAGGGLGGDLTAVTKNIAGVFPGGRAEATKTCGVLANPVVQGGSLLLGVAMLFVPGAAVVKGVVTMSVSLAAGLTISAVLAMLPEMLADMVAGTATTDIVGEEVGNAMASGGGALMSNSLAAHNGNGLMTKTDVVAYNTAQSTTTDTYIADELRNTSPFDANNPNSFLGSIASSLLPVSNTSNPIGFLGSFANTSLSNLVPKTNAVSLEKQKAALEVCQDQDALESGYAVDPFCNPIRGIPPQYLNREPLAVIDDLISRGDLSEEGKPQGEYVTFITECITGNEPPGYQHGTDFNSELAKKCIVNDDNANYFLYYQDNRIENGMAGEDTGEEESAPVTINDKKTLAQKIVAKNNIKYLSQSPAVMPTLDAIANGSIDPNNEPCGININILRIIDMITDKHSITISDINRHCNGDSAASGTMGRHYAGNGSALDIAVIDGKATTGRDANALSILAMIAPFMAETALGVGSYAQVGQIGCRPGPEPLLPTGVRKINDSCNHLHVDVPAKSDPNLKYNAAGS